MTLPESAFIADVCSKVIEAVSGKEIPCVSCANDELQRAKQVNPNNKTQSLFIFIFRLKLA
jgi:hypothetical protein